MQPSPLLNDIKYSLLSKIRDRSAVVGVVGLGYVGLPFAVEKAKVGYRVLGIDRNADRVEKVARGENYIGDVDDAELREIVKDGSIEVFTDFESVAEMDVIVVCVPTPLGDGLQPDLQYVREVTRQIASRLRPGQLISLESTTYPGTTEEVMLPLLSESGLALERDFFLCHSPERVDPGNQRYTTKNTNKVVGGVGPESLDVAVEFYSQTIEHVVPVSNARAAELCKVFENTFRAVNIALVNELAMLCDRMELDVWEVLDAANTKPFGIMPFYPGPGVGGHCIPIDPHYLEWKARELGFETRFIALAGRINRGMPAFVVEKAQRSLAERGVNLRGAAVLLLGAAYKADIDDWRESPALDIMRHLVDAGAHVRYHDKYVPKIEDKGMELHGVPLDESILAWADLVLIATDHSGIDYDWVVQKSRLVLDTRNATRGITKGRERIVLL
jgi:UDP-N-acetyl-D-glucosamine dehydrogenase